MSVFVGGEGAVRGERDGGGGRGRGRAVGRGFEGDEVFGGLEEAGLDVGDEAVGGEVVPILVDGGAGGGGEVAGGGKGGEGTVWNGISRGRSERFGWGVTHCTG